VIFLVECCIVKVPPDGRYQFDALFPDWTVPVGNLGPALTCGVFFLRCAGQRVMGRDQMLSATSITIPIPIASAANAMGS
jgi:hypothetical protein